MYIVYTCPYIYYYFVPDLRAYAQWKPPCCGCKRIYQPWGIPCCLRQFFCFNCWNPQLWAVRSCLAWHHHVSCWHHHRLMVHSPFCLLLPHSCELKISEISEIRFKSCWLHLNLHVCCLIMLTPHVSCWKKSLPLCPGEETCCAAGRPGSWATDKSDVVSWDDDFLMEKWKIFQTTNQ